jgi:hypothetical protein
VQLSCPGEGRGVCYEGLFRIRIAAPGSVHWGAPQVLLGLAYPISQYLLAEKNSFTCPGSFLSIISHHFMAVAHHELPSTHKLKQSKARETCSLLPLRESARQVGLLSPARCSRCAHRGTALLPLYLPSVYCVFSEDFTLLINLTHFSRRLCTNCFLTLQDDYVIGKELGRGRFSVVCECVNKETGQHAAVKIIDKSTIEPEEKGLLRTEIAGM